MACKRTFIIRLDYHLLLKEAQEADIFAARLNGLQCGIKIIIDICENFAIGKKH